MAPLPDPAAQEQWIIDNNFNEENAKITGSSKIGPNDVTQLRRWIAAYQKFKLGRPPVQPITE
jgi:hypothetical protein